ncbi:hypothetical protein [Croceiramulus getboli]|nr:hypothetical protein P8624_02155 [Flavobacteriaceae bacterium YJPT1-3]
MTRFLLLLAVALTPTAHGLAQKSKGTSVTIPKISYPEYPTPDNVETYMVAIVNKEGQALPFSEQELQDEVQFENFKAVAEEESPDLFIALQGLQIEDIDVTVKRSKAKERFYLSMLPKEGAVIGILTMAHGESVHYNTLAITPRTTADQQVIPETLEFDFDEAEQYLEISADESQFKGTPALVEAYTKQVLGPDFVNTRLAPYLYELYDTRAETYAERLYYIKDKKNDELSEETEQQLEALEALSQSLSKEDITNGASVLDAQVIYWKGLLSSYPEDSKSHRDVRWGILKNLYYLALAQGKLNDAVNYHNQIDELDINGLSTGLFKAEHNSKVAVLEKNFDLNTGTKIVPESFEKDEMMKSLEAREEAFANNIEKKEGLIITTEGEKLEGLITLSFILPPSDEPGTMINLDGDQTAKIVYLTYENDKGKTKTKGYKARKVQRVEVDGKVFAPVNPAADELDTAVNIANLSFNNTVFMQEVHTTDAVILYKDLTKPDAYFFKFPEDKKAAQLEENFGGNFNEVTAETFSACPELSERIANGEFQSNEADLIKIVDAFNTCQSN